MSKSGFVQLVEFRTNRIDEAEALTDRWVEAIGAKRTAMGTTLCADREHPGTFVRIVQFPSYEAAMANSEHPATARFAKEFEALCEGDLTFRNLDTVSTETF